METVAVHELFTFFSMTAIFCIFALVCKFPIGISMALGAISGAIIGGYFFPPGELIRHLVEGMFSYLDPILIITTATIFMFCIEKSGLLGSLANWIIRKFHHIPFLLLGAITLVIMFPGMLTGSSTAAVLTTGALMAPVLMNLGIPRDKTGAIIALAALLGMAAPPVNIPALIIGAGVDLPYVGLDLPLLVFSLIPALIFTWGLGLPHCSKSDGPSEDSIPKSYFEKHGLKLFIPLVVVSALLIGERVYPDIFSLGLPLIFMIGAVTAFFSGNKFNFLDTSSEAMKSALPILGILMGVGMFIQIMTLTGARGEVVIQALRLPRGWDGLYPIMAITLPLFGAVSSFGAASVLGVPYVLALPTSSVEIIVNAAAISIIASLGDLMPPTALAGLFAAQVVEEKNYFRVLRWCIIPGIIIAVMGILMIQYSSVIGQYLVFLESGT